ncbi:MAG: tyrosine-type recombinase/integrase [Anaerolineae bacterium]|nr:tyrosine-type recombinase/integrase [Anaerolineae bacterium]
MPSGPGRGNPDDELNGAIQAYLDTLQQEPNTLRTYSSGLHALVTFLSQHQAVETPLLRLSSLDTDVLASFQGYLLNRGYSRFTVRTYMAAALAFLDYLLTHDLLPASFSLDKAKARLRRPRRGDPYPAPVPDPALPLVIRHYDQMPLPSGEGQQARLGRLRVLRSRAIVHTLYSSAGRIAEVTSLDRRDVADGRQSEVVVVGKGGKQRFVYLTRLACRAIQDYVTERNDAFQPLFISHGRDYGSRLSKVSIWRTVKLAARAYNLEVSPHDFRHFRARQMLDEGAPLEAIQEILGHSDISTTRKVYAIYSRHSVRQIFARSTLAPEEALEKVDPELLAEHGDLDPGRGPAPH